MADTFWLKQTKEQPLFEDLLWSRPENKAHAGKILIIGGDAHSFGVPGEAYAVAQATGIGVARVALPDSVKKLVPSPMHHEIDFLPGIKNGSFAKSGLGELLELGSWADVVLLAGGVGRNSETSALLARFVQEFKGRLVITGDALDLLHDSQLTARQDTVLVAALGQLQKLWPHRAAPVVASSDSLQAFVDKLHELSQSQPATIVTVHNLQLCVAHGGQASTTPCSDEIWRVKTAARSAVWWAQHPIQPFEAVSTSIVY